MPTLPPRRANGERPRQTRHHALYATRRWQDASVAYREANPLCVECEREGKTTASQVVDHIKPHKGDVELFWSVDNWQALCKRCHDRKTARGE